MAKLNSPSLNMDMWEVTASSKLAGNNRRTISIVADKAGDKGNHVFE